MNSPKLGFEFIAANQSQKHVTANEALLVLDVVSHVSVVNMTTTSPPGSPAIGDAYIVATGASGAWVGLAGDLVFWDGTTWIHVTTSAGFKIVDASTGRQWIHDGTAFRLLASAPSGIGFGMHSVEQVLTCSGATVTSTIEIPNRSICVGVTSKVATTITGATSFDCGISGQASKFGGTLGLAAGSTNVGVIGPEAFYSDTPIVLTANGGNFTGGSVRVVIHYLEFSEAP